MWRIIYSLLLIGLIVSCNNQADNNTPKIKWSQEQSTALNKELAAQESIDIQLYIDRKPQLTFQQTGSGLQVAFIKDSLGEPAQSGQTAFVEFEIKLLDGTVAYATQPDELNQFKVDRSEVESGVQEAIKRMSVGDQCELIVPSHLGHGLVGDMNKIPPLTPLIINLKLIKLK